MFQRTEVTGKTAVLKIGDIGGYRNSLIAEVDSHRQKPLWEPGI